MITLPPGIRVLVWPVPVDFAGAALRVRRGMDRLAALVPVTLRRDPFAGDVFVFRSPHSFSRQSRPELGAVPARWHLPPPPGRRGGHYLAPAGELVRQAATGSPAEGQTETLLHVV
jgi:hypothetical protein